MLLLRLPEDTFEEEFKKLAVRRWKHSGTGLKFIRTDQGIKEDLVPTEADRIQLTAQVLSRPTSRGGCDLGNLEHLDEYEGDDPRVNAIFPLHNYAWLDAVGTGQNLLTWPRVTHIYTPRQVMGTWEDKLTLSGRLKECPDASRRCGKRWRNSCCPCASPKNADGSIIVSNYVDDREELLTKIQVCAPACNTRARAARRAYC